MWSLPLQVPLPCTRNWARADNYSVDSAAGKLSGKYNAGKSWGPYTATQEGGTLTLVSDGGKEVDTYKKIDAIPDSVKNNTY